MKYQISMIRKNGEVDLITTHPFDTELQAEDHRKRLIEYYPDLEPRLAVVPYHVTVEATRHSDPTGVVNCPEPFECMFFEGDHAFAYVCPQCAAKLNLKISDGCCGGKTCHIEGCQNETSLLHYIFDFRGGGLNLNTLPKPIVVTPAP